MAHYIDKDLIVAEIERLIDEIYAGRPFDSLSSEQQTALWYVKSIMSSVNTLEVKEADIWHLQEKEDIYNAVKDWSPYAFACIMKDGTIQRFTGIMDEDCDGHINVHIVGVNDSYDNVDDIVKWIEIT